MTTSGLRTFSFIFSLNFNRYPLAIEVNCTRVGQASFLNLIRANVWLFNNNKWCLIILQDTPLPRRKEMAKVAPRGRNVSRSAAMVHQESLVLIPQTMTLLLVILWVPSNKNKSWNKVCVANVTIIKRYHFRFPCYRANLLLRVVQAPNAKL